MASVNNFPNDDALLWYLAGVFDGEGSVCAYFWGNRPSVVCKVGMTDIGVIELFRERFPGNFVKSRPANKKYNTLFYWQCANKRLRPFLEQMYWRCPLKGKALKLCLDYIDRLDNSQAVSFEERLARVDIMKSIRACVTRTNAKPLCPEKINAYLGSRPKSNPVLDEFGNRYESHLDASRAVGVKGSHLIKQAIEKGWKCGGRRWLEVG